MAKGALDRRIKRALIASGFALAVLFAVPAHGKAAQTFGSNLNSPANLTIPCATTCSVWHTSLPVANTANSVFSPITGVVTSFTLKKSAGNWPFIYVRVAIPLAGPSGIPWKGGARTPDVLPANTAGIQAFPVRLPVTAGDFVAVNVAGDGNIYAGSTNALTAARGVAPAFPADGSQATSTILDDLEVLAQYAVEADADGDGFGDETQDQCAGQNGPNAGCPVKKKKCKKRKGKGKASAAKKKCKKRRK